RARTLYEAARKATPADARAWARLGELDVLDDRLSPAKIEFAQALTLDPQSRAAQRGLADVAARTPNSNYHEAVETAGPIVVPMVAVDPLPVVKVRLNGTRDAYFLIDTGAPTVVIAPALARELRADATAAGSGVFAGGLNAEVRQTELASVALGDAAQNKVSAMVLPMEGAPAPKGVRIEGLIGTGFFYHYLTTLDYAHGQLILAPKSASARFEAAAAARRAIITRLWFAQDHFLFVRAGVNGAFDGLFNIDTGGDGVGVQLAERFVGAAKVTLDTAHASKMSGPGGDVTTVPFTASVTLGGHERQGVPGLVTLGGDQYGIFPFAVAGTLSHQYFKGHSVTFDFEAMKLAVD
ncbi:MAG: aspartyl protease family protein, partial [Pseudomonadota bacterium]|nr:aspartyl protease family protein [Pseudomonadota bacterium]